MHTMRSATRALATCLAVTLAGSVRADIPGTYVRTQSVDGGSIRYTLNLRGNGDAELISERKDYPRLERDNIEDYGNILETLDRYDRVRHTGNWSRRGDRNRDFRINFKRMFYGNSDNYTSMDSDGTVDRNTLRLENWRPSLYGKRTEFRLERSGGGRGNNNALIAGAAVLAIGAIIASSQHHGGSSNINFDSIDHQTGGRGTYRISYRSPEDIRSVHVQLRRNGRAKIGINLNGDGFFVEGRWSRSGGKNVRIDVDRAFDRDRMRGGGTVTLRNAREIEKLDLDYSETDGGDRYHINFTAARG